MFVEEDLIPLISKHNLLDWDGYMALSEEPAEFDKVYKQRTEFSGRYDKEVGCFSNFAIGQMILGCSASKGFPAQTHLKFLTTEHLFQYEKYRLATLSRTMTEKEAEAIAKVAKKIREADGPGGAKAEARKAANLALLPSVYWELWHSNLKLGVMRYALWKKFIQRSCFLTEHLSDKFAERLQATHGTYVVEICPHEDHYWGIHKGEGENMLGRMLTELREQKLEGPLEERDPDYEDGE